MSRQMAGENPLIRLGHGVQLFFAVDKLFAQYLGGRDGVTVQVSFLFILNDFLVDGASFSLSWTLSSFSTMRTTLARSIEHASEQGVLGKPPKTC